MYNVSADIWMNDLVQAWKTAHEKYPALPIHLFGYSIGGSLASAFTNEHPELPVSSLILSAPSLFFTSRASFIRILTLFSAFDWALPSYAPESLRAHSKTSLAAYDGLFDLGKRGKRSACTERALFILGKDDILVDSDSIEKWVKKGPCPHWSILTINPEPEIEGTGKHLLIKETGVGKTAWVEIQSGIRAFLESSS